MDFELTEDRPPCARCPRHARRTARRSWCGVAAAGKDADDKLWRRGAELGWTAWPSPRSKTERARGFRAVPGGRGVAARPPPVVADSALTRLELARPAGLAGARPPGGDREASLAPHGTVACARRRRRPAAERPRHRGPGGRVGRLAAGDGGEPTAGRRLVLVDRPRAAVEPRRTLDETRRWYDVVLDGVRVQAADVVAADEADIKWLADAAAVLSAADSLGAGSGCSR